MNLHEYQTKAIFARYDILTPKGKTAASGAEAKQIAEELGGIVVIKAQVYTTGRGKAGGVRLVKNLKETEETATKILGLLINELPVYKVLVDEAVNIQKELYLAVINDRNGNQPLLVATANAGINADQTAMEIDRLLIKTPINPLLGIHEFQARDMALAINLPVIYWKPFIRMCLALWNIYKDHDATMVEINPLVITDENNLMALDCKMAIDDNALFRHPELVEMRDNDFEEPAEIEARKYQFSYIRLNGDIGCMVNGAGLAMATMDMVHLYGGRPANFLDIGGGANSERVSVAFKIILSDPQVKAILVNIFGGITRCDEVARGIIETIENIKPLVPIIVRLVGTHAKEGAELIASTKLILADTLEQAAQKAILAAKGEIEK